MLMITLEGLWWHASPFSAFSLIQAHALYLETCPPVDDLSSLRRFVMKAQQKKIINLVLD